MEESKMKRMFLAAVCCLFLTMTIDASNVLVLHWASGATTTFVLVDDEPRLTFNGDSIFVTTANSESHVGMSEVSGFSYVLDSQATAINSVQNGHVISLKDNRLDVCGLPSGSEVKVFDTAGRLYKSIKVGQDGRCSLSIDSLSKGVYIIRVLNFTTKITRR